LSFLQCFHTVDQVAGKASCPQKACATPKGCLYEQVEKEPKLNQVYPENSS